MRLATAAFVALVALLAIVVWRSQLFTVSRPRKAFDIFFAVGDPSRRSSLWRAWGTRKGYVFLTTAEVDSDFKLTLHPPDERHPASRCHLAYGDGESSEAARSGDHPTVIHEGLPKEFARAKGDGYGRFEDVWEPREIAPGLTLPFGLLLPDSELRGLRREVVAGRDVLWLRTGSRQGGRGRPHARGCSRSQGRHPTLGLDGHSARVEARVRAEPLAADRVAGARFVARGADVGRRLPAEHHDAVGARTRHLRDPRLPSRRG